MDSDLLMVIGICVAAISVPAVISAFSESRPPRVAAITLIIGGALIAFAIKEKPSGYSFGDIPDTFSRVFARISE